MHRKIVWGTKLKKGQVVFSFCLKRDNDLTGKHRHTKSYGTRQNVFNAKMNSVNRVLWELRGGLSRTERRAGF